MGPLAPDRTAPAAARFLLFSSRPALQAFFGTVAPDLQLAPVDVEEARSRPLENIAAAMVDVALDAGIGIAVCSELHRRRPELPVTAIVCCPHAVTPWTLRSLLSSGVSAVLDLEATRDEAARTLASVGRGASVLHLQLRRDNGELLRDLLTPEDRPSASQVRLLQLVALGLPDREIGERLHLSPHTVKHQIEQLRREVGVRNRTELAAWAGRNGFYAPGAAQPPAQYVRSGID